MNARRRTGNILERYPLSFSVQKRSRQSTEEIQEEPEKMKIYMKLRKINENDALMNRSEYEMKQRLAR